MMPDATRFLERLLWIADGRRDQTFGQGLEQGAIQRSLITNQAYFEGAVDALAAVASLPAEETTHYLHRMRGIANEFGLRWEESDRNRDTVYAAPIPGSPQSAADPERDVPSWPPDVRGSGLVSRVSVPAVSQTWRGGRIRLLSLGTCVAGIVVRRESNELPVLSDDELAECKRAGGHFPEPGRRMMQELRASQLREPKLISMHDDAGHEYSPSARESDGGDGVKTGKVEFTPGLRAGASRLTITFDDAVFEVSVK